MQSDNEPKIVLFAYSKWSVLFECLKRYHITHLSWLSDLSSEWRMLLTMSTKRWILSNHCATRILPLVVDWFCTRARIFRPTKYECDSRTGEKWNINSLLFLKWRRHIATAAAKLMIMKRFTDDISNFHSTFFFCLCSHDDQLPFEPLTRPQFHNMFPSIVCHKVILLAIAQQQRHTLSSSRVVHFHSVDCKRQQQLNRR